MREAPFFQAMLVLLAAAGAAWAQTAAPPAAPLAFEVASIKLSGPLDRGAIISGRARIGTTVDNAQVSIGFASLMALICQAYAVKPYQVKGGADWLNTERFDIAAKLPEGATQDQVPAMLQTLLAERFKLALHRDTRESPVYALVEGKGGPKFKEAAPDAPAPTGDAGPGQPASPPPPAKGEIVMGSGENQVRVRQVPGGMVVNTRQTGAMDISMENGTIHMHARKMTMEMLTVTLSQYLDRPVVDQTQLKGAYELALDLSMADALRMAANAGIGGRMAMAGRGGNAASSPADAASEPAGTSLFISVDRLGLKLEPRKLPYEYLVIDHLEKTPTDN